MTETPSPLTMLLSRHTSATSCSRWGKADGALFAAEPSPRRLGLGGRFLGPLPQPAGPLRRLGRSAAMLPKRTCGEGLLGAAAQEPPLALQKKIGRPSPQSQTRSPGRDRLLLYQLQGMTVCQLHPLVLHIVELQFQPI
jgi:hypothetical protein